VSGLNKRFYKMFKNHGFIIGLSLILLIAATIFRQWLYGIFGEDNYLSLHIIMDFFIITIAFTIAIQSWSVFPDIFLQTIITQQKLDQEKIRHMAFYDELTNLPNIRFLKESIPEMIAGQKQGEKLAVVVLDIDRFKKINEAFGHSLGDRILKAIAKRMESLPDDEKMILARLTGDEFALILKDAKEEKITEIVQRVHRLFNEPIKEQHLFVNVSLTVGGAIYPDHGQTFEELLQHANAALAEAKLLNKPQLFYEPAMDGKAFELVVLENDLFYALSKNELFLVYQPQINIQTGEIIGVEALLRWKHSKRGMISPAKFIPIAEVTGLIIPIGEWVLRTACRQMKNWLDQGLPPMIMSVNLSIRQFYQQDLVEKVKEILDETGLAPEYLELEITESMMMNIEHTQKLQSLKRLGVKIAVDDFGTGYSSLAYLKHFPFDRLKIDKSFIEGLLHNESDTKIVSTIIAMAKHLNLSVIAEGVETSRQKEILLKENCTFVQGYLFSPPLSPSEFIEKYEQIKKKAEDEMPKLPIQ
jgi:diguanylate cyclase (GGDEF)-like protein